MNRSKEAVQAEIQAIEDELFTLVGFAKAADIALTYEEDKEGARHVLLVTVRQLSKRLEVLYDMIDRFFTMYLPYDELSDAPNETAARPSAQAIRRRPLRAAAALS